MAFTDWSSRLSQAGASVTEVQAIAASYQSAPATVQAALDTLIEAAAIGDLIVMLNTWRANAGPFQDGYPGGGLPFGTRVPILTGQTADDAYAVGAGTGAKVSVSGGSGSSLGTSIAMSIALG